MGPPPRACLSMTPARAPMSVPLLLEHVHGDPCPVGHAAVISNRQRPGVRPSCRDGRAGRTGPEQQDGGGPGCKRVAGGRPAADADRRGSDELPMAGCRSFRTRRRRGAAGRPARRIAEVGRSTTVAPAPPPPVRSRLLTAEARPQRRPPGRHLSADLRRERHVTPLHRRPRCAIDDHTAASVTTLRRSGTTGATGTLNRGRHHTRRPGTPHRLRHPERRRQRRTAVAVRRTPVGREGSAGSPCADVRSDR